MLDRYKSVLAHARARGVLQDGASIARIREKESEKALECCGLATVARRAPWRPERQLWRATRPSRAEGCLPQPSTRRLLTLLVPNPLVQLFFSLLTPNQSPASTTARKQLVARGQDVARAAARCSGSLSASWPRSASSSPRANSPTARLLCHSIAQGQRLSRPALGLVKISPRAAQSRVVPIRAASFSNIAGRAPQRMQQKHKQKQRGLQLVAPKAHRLFLRKLKNDWEEKKKRRTSSCKSQRLIVWPPSFSLPNSLYFFRF